MFINSIKGHGAIWSRKMKRDRFFDHFPSFRERSEDIGRLGTKPTGHEGNKSSSSSFKLLWPRRMLQNRFLDNDHVTQIQLEGLRSHRLVVIVVPLPFRSHDEMWCSAPTH